MKIVEVQIKDTVETPNLATEEEKESAKTELDSRPRFWR